MKKSILTTSYQGALLLLVVSAFLFACSGSGGSDATDLLAETSDPSSDITVTPDLPADIFTDGSAASTANITQAATFAWNEFIALNWPALTTTRDTANTNLTFGSQGGGTPLVWHTFRNKVEIYPGDTSNPPPGYNASAPDLGYSTVPPVYVYDPTTVGTSSGQIDPYSGTPSGTTPFINLDEKNEIGAATMFAGIGDSDEYPASQILFLAKANSKEFIYAGQNDWYAGGTDFASAQSNTISYINDNGNTPPANSMDSLISFPSGTVEIKTAWRRLTTDEANSGRFYQTTVRYYKDDNGTTKYVDDTFGMLALHIIHKTPTAPYFIYATFEQADNILTTSGDQVEDVDGNIINSADLTPTTPNFTVTNATPTTPMTFDPTTASSTPGKSLYYQNIAGQGLPTGTVTYNRRINSIPQEIIDVNESAHSAISDYNSTNGITNSPWPYYKLVNVQWKPIQKTHGVDYTGADSATYYLSNSVVESDYILQKFSGEFSQLAGAGDFTITDYDKDGNGIYNSYYDGTKYLMGGCMGCHGNATNGGSDYSFILGLPVKEPEYASPVDLTEDRIQQLTKFLKK